MTIQTIKKTFVLSFLTIFSIVGGYTQPELHLDVEGKSRLVGHMDLVAHASDTTSIHIGRSAGISQDFSMEGQNTFLGNQAGRINTDGNQNSYFGYKSGHKSTGSFNAFSGAFSGEISTGSYNAFYGHASPRSNTTGNGNSFFGKSSGYSNTKGFDNCFFGSSSGSSNTEGEYNTFYGNDSGGSNKTGSNNAFFGVTSGSRNKTGSKNTLIGATSNFTSGIDSLDWAIAIGYNAQVGCSNCAVIGGTGADSVNVGIGITTPERRLHVEGKTKFVGHMDLVAHGSDTTSIHIGRSAGTSQNFSMEGQNTFIGNLAGRINTDGRQNSFYGHNSARSNTTGNGNSFFGKSSGYSNTKGLDNCFFGSSSGSSNTEGEYNTFYGNDSGGYNETGSNNAFFGVTSGARNKTGSKNTLIGAISNFTSGIDSLDRAIALGYNAKVGCHNCAVIGGTGVDAVKVGIGNTTPEEALHVVGKLRVDGTQLFLRETNQVISLNTEPGSGYVQLDVGGTGHSGDHIILGEAGAGAANFIGIGTTSPNDALDVVGDIDATGCFQTGDDDGSPVGGTCTSDRRLKENIFGLDAQLAKLMDLRPVTFRWKHKVDQEDEISEIGLIAQEVEAVFPEMVITDEDDYKRIRYDISLQLRTIKAIQEQQSIIEQQRIQLELQNNRLNNQQSQIDELKALVLSINEIEE